MPLFHIPRFVRLIIPCSPLFQSRFVTREYFRERDSFSLLDLFWFLESFIQMHSRRKLSTFFRSNQEYYNSFFPNFERGSQLERLYLPISRNLFLESRVWFAVACCSLVGTNWKIYGSSRDSGSSSLFLFTPQPLKAGLMSVNLPLEVSKSFPHRWIFFLKKIRDSYLTIRRLTYESRTRSKSTLFDTK